MRYIIVTSMYVPDINFLSLHNILNIPPPLIVSCKPKYNFKCCVRKTKNQEYKKRKFDRKNRGR